MASDTIADIITSIQNADMYRKSVVRVAATNINLVCEDALLGAPFYFPIEAEPKPMLERMGHGRLREENLK